MQRSSSRPTASFAATVRYALTLCFAAVIGLMAASGADAMGFATATLGPCAERGCVVATGDIGALAAEDFAAFMKAEKVQMGALVLLDSDGGDVVSALKLGGIIRRAGLSTAVAAYDAADGALKPATCASACAYVLLGGVERTVVRGGRVGVHQVSTRSGWLDASDAQWMTSLIAVHVNKMGASFGVMTLAMSTSPSSMRWLTAPELASLGMVTGGAPEGAGAARQTLALSGERSVARSRVQALGVSASLFASR